MCAFRICQTAFGESKTIQGFAPAITRAFHAARYSDRVTSGKAAEYVTEAEFKTLLVHEPPCILMMAVGCSHNWVISSLLVRLVHGVRCTFARSGVPQTLF